MARAVTWSKAAMLLVGGALVLGGCALQPGVPGGAASDPSSSGIAGGQSSSSDFGGYPGQVRRMDRFQAP
jgi:hypothetical protein